MTHQTIQPMTSVTMTSTISSSVGAEALARRGQLEPGASAAASRRRRRRGEAAVGGGGEEPPSADGGGGAGAGSVMAADPSPGVGRRRGVLDRGLQLLAQLVHERHEGRRDLAGVGPVELGQRLLGLARDRRRRPGTPGPG